MARKHRIFLNKRLCFASCRRDHLGVFDCFHAEVGQAPLLAAIEHAGAAQREVVFGKLEAVFRSRQRFEALKCARRLAVSVRKTICLMVAADDAAAQLVELRKPK